MVDDPGPPEDRGEIGLLHPADLLVRPAVRRRNVGYDELDGPAERSAVAGLVVPEIDARVFRERGEVAQRLEVEGRVAERFRSHQFVRLAPIGLDLHGDSPRAGIFEHADGEIAAAGHQGQLHDLRVEEGAVVVVGGPLAAAGLALEEPVEVVAGPGGDGLVVGGRQHARIVDQRHRVDRIDKIAALDNAGATALIGAANGLGVAEVGIHPRRLVDEPGAGKHGGVLGIPLLAGEPPGEAECLHGRTQQAYPAAVGELLVVRLWISPAVAADVGQPIRSGSVGPVVGREAREVVRVAARCRQPLGGHGRRRHVEQRVGFFDERVDGVANLGVARGEPPLRLGERAGAGGVIHPHGRRILGRPTRHEPENDDEHDREEAPHDDDVADLLVLITGSPD